MYQQIISCRTERIADEAFAQCVKCYGCPFNNPYEPKMRGCGETTCFVDENHKIIYQTTTAWNL